MISNNVENDDFHNNLIPIVNKLQDVCADLCLNEFDLPQIAVVGGQSAGKSSVLENLVGKEFLPRGLGIVTRRPLVLQLINDDEEYGEFDHSKERFMDFSAIRNEIEAETDREAGTNKAISSKPICLRIYSPNVVNLTLVDLPGITKVPVGEQSPDIEEQIKTMIIQFISKPNCLILLVTPANGELTNDDALKLAQDFDPNGDRTIGVLTKLDLMDPGTDARDIFEGGRLQLHHGWVGVVNRSQKDIDNKKDITETLEYERSFFRKNYKNISDRLGTPYLRKKLNKELTEHIRKTLPVLRKETLKEMVKLENEIAEFQKKHPNDLSYMKGVMRQIIQELQKDFRREIGDLGSDHVDTTRLTSGAKIKNIFHDRFPIEMSKIDYDEAALRREIVMAIYNLHGVDIGMEPPFKAFANIVQTQILDLEEPVKKCVDLVIEELSNAVRTCTERIANYPLFRDCIDDDIKYFIHCNLQSYEDVLSLVQMESAYMNIMHVEFDPSGSDRNISSPCGSCVSYTQGDLSEEDEDTLKKLEPANIAVNKIQNNICSYMKIVKKTLRDMVPKAIRFFIIRKLEDFIEKDLIDLLFNQTDRYVTLIGPSPDNAEIYEKKKKMYETYKKAREVMKLI